MGILITGDLEKRIWQSLVSFSLLTSLEKHLEMEGVCLEARVVLIHLCSSASSTGTISGTVRHPRETMVRRLEVSLSTSRPGLCDS